MKRQPTRRRRPASPQQTPVEVSVGSHGTVRVTALDDRALVRVTPSGSQPMEIEVAFTADGPVVRTRANALELTSLGRVTARCASFEVDAEENIALRSRGTFAVEARAVDVEATHEGVSIRANDDVQLLGEHVLLNCDPSPPVPAWVPVVPEPTPTVALQGASGDAALLAAVRAKG